MCVCVYLCVLVTQSCPTSCNPMDYSLPGFSVHEILQTKVLEWVAFPSPGYILHPGLLQADSLPSDTSEKPLRIIMTPTL